MSDQRLAPEDGLADAGDFLHVPVEQRLDHDDVVNDEIADDQLRVDFADVPDGDFVDLTALPDDDEEGDR